MCFTKGQSNSKSNANSAIAVAALTVTAGILGVGQSCNTPQSQVPNLERRIEAAQEHEQTSGPVFPNSRYTIADYQAVVADYMRMNVDTYTNGEYDQGELRFPQGWTIDAKKREVLFPRVEYTHWRHTISGDNFETFVDSSTSSYDGVHVSLSDFSGSASGARGMLSFDSSPYRDAVIKKVKADAKVRHIELQRNEPMFLFPSYSETSDQRDSSFVVGYHGLKHTYKVIVDESGKYVVIEKYAD